VAVNNSRCLTAI